MIADLIIENEQLFNAFLRRYNEYNIGAGKLVAEMNEDGIVMDKKRLQRFVIHGFSKRITQRAYLWLLYRHGIEVSLNVKGKVRSNEENRLISKQFTQ